jgi:hypothetical protein
MTLGQFSFLAGPAEQRARGGLAAHQRHGHTRRYAALPVARPARCGSSISWAYGGDSVMVLTDTPLAGRW